MQFVFRWLPCVVLVQLHGYLTINVTSALFKCLMLETLYMHCCLFHGLSFLRYKTNLNLSTVVQIMHFVCSVQNHCMNQLWFILKWILGIKLQQALRDKMMSKWRLLIHSPFCIVPNELYETITICNETYIDNVIYYNVLRRY